MNGARPLVPLPVFMAWAGQTLPFFFYVLLTVHLSIPIFVINQLDAQNFVLQ